MPRDVHADRQPGAEPPLALPDDDEIVVSEYAADLSPGELAKLVQAERQRRLGDALPNDVPGSGTRRR